MEKDISDILEYQQPFPQEPVDINNTNFTENKTLINKPVMPPFQYIHTTHTTSTNTQSNQQNKHTNSLQEETIKIINNNIDVPHDVGSDLNDSYSSEQDTPYHKLTYSQLEETLDKQYNDINHKYSSALDILASYLKGHKIIYMESKYYCDQQLNKLMMPSIVLSTSATVLSSFLSTSVANTNQQGPFIIACVNAIISVLLALSIISN